MKQQDFMYDTWKKVKLCTRVKHPKNENDHSNHQSCSIQNPLAKGYSEISQPYLQDCSTIQKTEVPQTESSAKSCLHSDGFC